MKNYARTLALCGAMVATVAIAGHPVFGYGDTRAEAAKDAERAAQEESYRIHKKRYCYTPLKPQDCKKDESGWVCEISVANHSGSC